MESKEIKSFGIGLGIGLLIGASVGILFAPQKGEYTRKLIKEKAVTAHKKVKGVVETIKSKLPIVTSLDKVHNK
jgi:gas vesicle protein